ncbi:MAG: aldo/keto reductase [Gammaproteobacteria bacterium]|nr:aldo/keto reductase [Gammaproteobacteria bacterium]
MRTKTLGHSGLEVSAVGLGCMNFGMMNDQTETDRVVATALDCGVNFFDVADIYGGANHKAEAMLGKALGDKRNEVIVATKFGAGGGGGLPGGGKADYIVKAVESSLKLLGTDYIDLYQHHFPDAETPIDETMRALDDLVQQGKVRFIGCSNYSGEQLAEANGFAIGNDSSRYTSAQNRYSLLTRTIEQDLIPVAEREQVGILPYFPLESGLLTGKYKQDVKPGADTRFGKWAGGGHFASDKRYAIVEQLRAYGDEIGRSVLEIAIGWLVAQPTVSSVIAGVTKPEQIEQNVAAADWIPTDEQVNRISELAAL